MKATKKVIGSLEKCYALGTFDYEGVPHVVAAAEKKNPCYSFDLQGNLCDTLWEGPGGVMTMEQAPGSDGAFIATHEFYSPNDSARAACPGGALGQRLENSDPLRRAVRTPVRDTSPERRQLSDRLLPEIRA